MVETLSTNPSDYDGRIPLCQWCSDGPVIKRLTTMGGALVCMDCYEEWRHGRYDQDPPADDTDTTHAG